MAATGWLIKTLPLSCLLTNSTFNLAGQKDGITNNIYGSLKAPVSVGTYSLKDAGNSLTLTVNNKEYYANSTKGQGSITITEINNASIGHRTVAGTFEAIFTDGTKSYTVTEGKFKGW
jgi:hypothetical protein